MCGQMFNIGGVEEVTIKDLPVKKWFNLSIRVKHDKMDTYINGTIVNRHKFNSPVNLPKGINEIIIIQTVYITIKNAVALSFFPVGNILNPAFL